MPYGRQSNFGLVTLAADITAVALAASLQTGDDSNLPAAPFFLCAWDSDAVGNPLLSPSARELILVTARTGVNLTTIARGQESTTAAAWPAGTKLIVVETAEMRDRMFLIQSDKTYFKFHETTGEPCWSPDGVNFYYMRPVVVGSEVLTTWVAV